MGAVARIQGRGRAEAQDDEADDSFVPFALRQRRVLKAIGASAASTYIGARGTCCRCADDPAAFAAKAQVPALGSRLAGAQPPGGELDGGLELNQRARVALD